MNKENYFADIIDYINYLKRDGCYSIKTILFDKIKSLILPDDLTEKYSVLTIWQLKLKLNNQTKFVEALELIKNNYK